MKLLTHKERMIVNIQNVIETTSELQKKNETREFLDTITGRSYTSYKSGYVRRIIYYKHGKDMYQLNLRNKDTGKRILVSSESDRLEMIQNHINNTRKKLK